ncbi:MAG: peptidoglycan DD-metalloendopeptidase family protein [Chloroflexi bacterium]|nr:peptidoglycan DD-metalloendopeptidase family protein [Chloroflexota bacterium]
MDFAIDGTQTFVVEAMAAGTVVKADCDGTLGLGCVVAVRHTVGGSVLVYGHLASVIIDGHLVPDSPVQKDYPVVQGSVLGKAGGTGGRPVDSHMWPVHLHIELRDGGVCMVSERCLADGLWGNPIGWDDLMPLVDGYRIAGYRDKADTDAGTYNYDGSAVRGETRVLYDTFRYIDKALPKQNEPVATVGRTVAVAIVDVSFNVLDRCTGPIEAVDCEHNSDPYANPGTQFAGNGVFVPEQDAQSSGRVSAMGSARGRLVSSNVPVWPTPPPPPGTDSATFITDVTLTDGTFVSPGQALVKTWRMRDTGGTTWGSGYQLAFVSGEQMGAPSAVNVPTTAPGSTADISVNLTAPSTEGQHVGRWQLRNPSGTYFGPVIWIIIQVKTSTPTVNIILFDITPASPSSEPRVHLVGRAKRFDDFRSMRFVAGSQQMEMTNIVSIGDQWQISADWETGGLPRGNYAISFEVSSKSKPDWADAERLVKNYTLTGTPTPIGHPPERPVLKEPYNWYLKDAGGANASVRMCAYTSTDPDGDVVKYYFQLQNQIGDPVSNSGWITSTCWEPTLSPGIYSWKVKAGDGTNESAWSLDTWNFSVADNHVTIIWPPIFYEPNTNNTHICVPVSYGGIIAPDVYAWVNRKADGSESGEWRLLDHYGPDAGPDCDRRDSRDPLAPVHGFWIRSPEYVTGQHVLRVTATKRDSGSSATKSLTFDIAYIRPSDFQPVAPSTFDNNGTFWNNLSINFQWTAALRADNFKLRASTSSDIWNDTSPILDVNLSGTTTAYTYTFGHDYDKLYWSVKATNSVGSADTGNTPWFGIDRVAPTSSVQTLPSTTYESVFQVNWSGSDNRAGIRSYDIQYMDSSRGTWVDWLTSVPVSKTYDLFTGQPGHTYSFRSRATDNAGNTGSYPGTADTSIKVDPDTRPPTPWWNAAYIGKRNITILDNMPSITMTAGYPVRLHFDSTTTPSAADIYNASLSSPKCNDLRIVYNDATELDRLVDNCSSSTIDIWFRTQVVISGGSSNNTAHQLYYGNATAGSPPAGRNQVLYPVLDSNHLRVFDMREGTGSTLHDLAGGVDATIASELSWDPSGKFGPALLFPGDRTPEPRPAVYAGIGPQPACDFTAELWLKRLTGHQYNGELAQQEIGGPNPWRWDFAISDERLELSVMGTSGSVRSDGTLSAPTFFSDWHHVAVTHSCSGEVRFYIDGRLDSVRTMSTGNVDPAVAPLRLGNNAYNTHRLAGYMSGFALSNIVRTNFSYGQFADITNEPSVAVGTSVNPPISGTRDLAVLNLATYPNSGNGALVEAVVVNTGTLNTGNGFYTDLYLNHRPTGTGDYTGTIRFWVNDPITAGARVTLTTVITDLASLSGLSAQTLTPASEITGTLYVQVDSTGAVSETSKGNNIYSAGTGICLANPDAYEGDDTSENAKPITIGSPQTHNFSAPGDHDWMKFDAPGGVTYTLRTSSLGAASDTFLYLYDRDRTTLLASNDDYGGTLASQIEWMAPVTGTYYVLVQHWNPNVGGCGTNYNLSIVPGGVATAMLLGQVTLDGSLRPITGWVIPLSVTLGGNPSVAYVVTTTDNGAFTIPGIISSTYTVTIVGPHNLINRKRDLVVAPPTVTVNMGTLSEGNVNMDNQVNISDFGILVKHYLTSGDPYGCRPEFLDWIAAGGTPWIKTVRTYNCWTDFDWSGQTNIGDFGLLAKNYLRTGPIDLVRQ